MNGDREAFLKARYDQTQADHDALRFVMIHKSMNFDPDPTPDRPNQFTCNIAKLKTRDPCFGFLDLRGEIVVALLQQGLRWGAAHFGPNSNGDMMHFDLGASVRPDLVLIRTPMGLGISRTEASSLKNER